MTDRDFDFTPLRAIGWPFVGAPDDLQWQACFEKYPQARPARVVEQHRSGYVVADAPEQGYAVESLPEWQRPRCPPEQRAAVGDWVLIEGATLTNRRIVALLPRRTVIKRGAAGEHYQQQLIAANVDTVFVVCGLDADFNPRRIERYILLVRGGGANAVVVLTKADKADGEKSEDALAALNEIIAQGVAAFALNAKDRDSIHVLDPWLQPGHTVVLVGSSGAGKSTLTNTLMGIDKMKTANVREHDARGRHTTTHRVLMALPSGACLIDTPGMRELKPTGEESLSEGGFDDVETLAAQCKFRDCAHANEPGCAVRAAIERGELDADRFSNYQKLSGELAGAAVKLVQQRARKSDAKVMGKALNKRLDEKYGKR